MRFSARVHRWLASTVDRPQQWFVDWWRSSPNDSGIDFSKSTPLTYAPLWYAINRIAGHVGQLPLFLYEAGANDSKTKAAAHPAFRLMARDANDDISAQIFRETLTAHALLYGNGRAIITRNNRGAPRELQPLPPGRTKTVSDAGKKWHIYTDDKQREIPIPDESMLHIQGLGADGISGYSVVELAKNSWGLGLAAERTSNRHFKHNAMPSMAIEAPRGTFRDEPAAREFLAKWQEFHEGGGKVALMSDGMKAVPLSMPTKDSEWLEQRRFQRQEVALWFSLETILGDDSSVSYNSLEQKNRAYLDGCLNRWLTKWETECSKKLLTERQKREDTHYFKFTTAALLKGSTKERYEVYQLGRQNEILSINDVRRLEDLDPIGPDGDKYSNPAINPKSSDSTDTPGGTRPAAETSFDLAAFTIQERANVITAARRPGNFCNWASIFYAGWKITAADIFTAAGLDDIAAAELAADYAAAALEDCLAAAGRAADQGELVLQLDAIDWDFRASHWSEKMGKLCNQKSISTMKSARNITALSTQSQLSTLYQNPAT